MAKPKDPSHPDYHECDICGAPLNSCQCDEDETPPTSPQEEDEDWRQYLRK